MKELNEKVETHLKPRDYMPNEVCRILNPKQQLLYIKNKLYPIDMYASIDEKTGNTVIVMIFLRNETTDAYIKWCNHELN